MPLLAAMLVFFMMKNQAEEFVSKSVIYTGLVSGFDLESGSEAKLDYHVVNSGFDNLINTIRSRETLKDVVVELLAGIVCGTEYAAFEENEWYQKLKQQNSSDANGTCDQPDGWAQDVERGTGDIYNLLFTSQTEVSLDKIGQRLSVKRVALSDLLETSFTASDAQFAYDFLTVLNSSFIDRYQYIKRKEVGSVVEYFESETKRSFDRLQTSVNEIRDFGTENRVINYYEQTKAIAGQKELIDQQIQQETMNLESAKSAVQDLETRMKASSEIREAGTELMRLRKQYASLTSSAVLAQTSQKEGPEDAQQLVDLAAQIKEGVATLYDARYSKEGLVITDAIEKWMNEVVSVAQSEASLAVLKARKREYIKTYDDFAPLGSTLSMLERELDIAENEYLELLHSLNQARMRQQNIEVSSSMEVLDPPSFPHESLPSKLKMLMAMSFIVCLILIISLIVALEIFDESLRSPITARAKTGMEVIGFLPRIETSKEEEWHQTLVSRCLAIFAARLKTNLSSKSQDTTQLVCVVSTSEGEGKSFLIEQVRKILTESGRKVICLTPEGHEAIVSEDSKSYEITREFGSAQMIDDVMSLTENDRTTILMELPPFSENEIPISLLQAAASVVWVACADRLWTELEKDTYSFVREKANIEPVLCLNKVEAVHLEPSIGEVTKSRSVARRFTKKLLRRNFS